MKLRYRAIHGWGSSLSMAFLIFCIGLFFWWILGISLSEFHPLKRYVDNPYISGILLVLVPAAIMLAYAKMKGFQIRWISISDNRTVYSRQNLIKFFRPDASSHLLVDATFLLSGSGDTSKSKVTFGSPIDEQFSIFACVRPIRKNATEHYWRAGFSITGPMGHELACCHLDHHNLIVGKIHGNEALTVVAPTQLNHNWSRIGITMCRCETPNEYRLNMHLDDNTFIVGSIPLGFSPWTLSLDAWSDNYRHHNVLFRDISFTRPQA